MGFRPLSFIAHGFSFFGKGYIYKALEALRSLV